MASARTKGLGPDVAVGLPPPRYYHYDRREVVSDMSSLSGPDFAWLRVTLTLVGSIILVSLLVLQLIPFSISDSTIFGRGPIGSQRVAQIRWILAGVGSLSTFALALTLLRNVAPMAYRTEIAIGYFAAAILSLLLVLLLG